MSATDRTSASGPDRRSLLKLMGAALAMAGPAACSRAADIIPYVRQPEDAVSGEPLHYATTLAIRGCGVGVVVTTRQGRPIKVEGNAEHPASRGATDAVMQATCLSLYDPDRSATPLRNGVPAGYDHLLADIAALRDDLIAKRGKGFALLTGRLASPLLDAQVAALRAALPEMLWRIHDPLSGHGERNATLALAGRPLATRHDLSKADVILALDADFLGEGPAKLADARDFAVRRRLRDGGRSMSRLYAFEPAMTLTGAAADWRRPDAARDIAGFAGALAARIADSGPATADPEIERIAAALRAAGPTALVLAGPHQPAAVHADTLRINAALGALGHTVDLIEPVVAEPEDGGDLATLCAEIDAGKVDTLLILDVNPAFTAPGDLDVAAALSRVGTTIHLGQTVDETARLCAWHVPATHAFEEWSDRRAYDGTASLVQPLVAPLKGGHSAHALLAALAGDFQPRPRDQLRDHWRAAGLSDEQFAASLRSGVVAGTRAEAVALPPLAASAIQVPPAAGDGMEIRFAPDAWLGAGETANNAWLQELPRPLTKLVWGNAARLAPATAARLGLATGDHVAITRDATELALPVFLDPGHAPDSVTLSLGYGRRAGSVAAGVGTDVSRLRRGGEWFATATIAKRDGHTPLVTLQEHGRMEGRDIVRKATLSAYLADENATRGEPDPERSVYPPWPYRQEAWGMVIDQSACIGCLACVSACQAENNTPTVGPEECAVGHEMHWLRVDRYYDGPPEAPSVAFQPVPCMQCEDAPCEVVCPVNATVHTHDGLNAQVYNRCVGTRYCSQNCPYKVRRFNFLDYADFAPDAALKPLMNPDVTVRSRGVMEKCTYCVQRINRARIAADIADGDIPDGTVRPACAQACPTEAIVFGDLNRKDSAVARLRRHPLNYTLLAELNTRPRTTYLARITNPAEDVPQEESSHV